MLDSAPEPEFDRLVQDLAAAFGSEHAELSIVTEERTWLKAAVRGAGASRVRGETLCAHVADTGTVLVVPDTALDAAYADHPSSTGPLAMRFFAGAPVHTPEGEVLGVLCAWDPAPRSPDAAQLQTLDRLAELATALLELRRCRLELEHDRVVLATTGAVLEMIAGGADLHDVLDTIARSVEEVTPTALCSIMLLDGDVLREGAAPSLPPAFRRAVDGRQIGAAAGSCGTAAFTRAAVITADVSADERWRDWAPVALQHGLRACWSLPIMGRDGDVTGAFALYHRQVREPARQDLEQLQRWVNLAELAIERARAIAALHAAATRDPLTLLANRPDLLRELQARLDGAAGVSALFVDLDHFKAVNDTHGHHLGDRFLRVVADRLSACVGPGDVVARFGGDEFVVVTTAPRPADVQRLGAELLRALEQPMTALGQTVTVAASIGVATAGPDGRHAGAPRVTAGELVGDADLAMYAAKSSGRGGITWFTPDLRERAQDRRQLKVDLARAVENGELVAVYQPKVEIRSGVVVGVEALLRWRSPTRGDVPPEVFIPVAEESGLIVAVGELVLRESCAQLAAWRADDPAWLERDVWVNVSAHQLAEPGFARVVHRTLHETGLAPSALGLEITETSVMDDERVAAGVLEELRSLGVSIAIDDFGIGFSSMSRLKHVPVDVLKIDRTFVTDVADDTIDAQIVAGLLALAGSLGLRVVAEGVETRAQRDRLLELGCGWAQGFWWSRPLSATDLVALVAEHDGVLTAG
ncbi:MAG: EAL domain-containing protein [Actinomycetota bacterium]